MSQKEKLMADSIAWQTCCDTVGGGEHKIECPKWEPPLTVEELRYLRRTILSPGNIAAGHADI